MKEELDEMDDALAERILESEEIIDRIEQNNEARKRSQDPSDTESEDRRKISLLYRILVNIHAKITHPQNAALIDAINRAREHDHPTAYTFHQYLQKIPLGRRDTVLSSLCEDRLDALKVPSKFFEAINIEGRIQRRYFNTFRPEDKMLHDFIASKKNKIDLINKYFSASDGRSEQKDQRACNALLNILDDISAVSASIHSPSVGRISEAIDKYRREGENFQADLIAKALHAVPLTERVHALEGPSLVKNALATQEDGVIFVDLRDSSRIDITRAPPAYCLATGQQQEERKGMNVIAPEAGLVATPFNTYERLKTAAPAARVIASDTPMMSPLASPSAPSPSAASTTSMDDAKSISMSADKSVEAMFANVVEKVTAAAPTKTSQFKGRLKAVEQSSPAPDELTLVEEIRHSHDATGDIIEEDLDSPHSGLDH
jgi:hypothetical protein